MTKMRKLLRLAKDNRMGVCVFPEGRVNGLPRSDLQYFGKKTLLIECPRCILSTFPSEYSDSELISSDAFNRNQMISRLGLDELNATARQEIGPNIELRGRGGVRRG